MGHEIEPEDSGRGWYFWLADIDLISAYKNPSGEYRYLTLDEGIHGGNIYGNWGYIALYATSFTDGEIPVKVAEIHYVGPEQTREMYFMGERVYEIGNLQNMIALYMEDYEEVEINKIPIQKYFPRDIVGTDESNQSKELQKLYDAIREATESS